MDYRNELKYSISYPDMLALRARLRAVMQRDPNVREDGSYSIRSLYFDDLRDSALYDKLNGVNCRDKYRIRYYNGDVSLIHLEKKSKRDGMCMKRSCEISAGDVSRILNGDIAWMTKSREPLTVEFGTKLACGLLPRAVVDYTREPFVYAQGNVRVTLDYDIRTGMELRRFLEADCVSVPAAKDVIILEVKWDEFLPSFIRDAVQLACRSAGAFSKYAACRTYA